MKKVLLIFIVVVLAGVGVVSLINLTKDSNKPSEKIPVSQMGEKTNSLKIESSSFGSYTAIPSKYTCDGENINPPLTITGVPQSSKSLVLIVDDPDAPGGTWVHWTVFNIDPSTARIAENSFPAGGIEGNTSFGTPGYGGPCPPSGQHRYFFKLYALDTKLNLDSSADKSAIEKAMEGHIDASTELVGFYSKTN